MSGALGRVGGHDAGAVAAAAAAVPVRAPRHQLAHTLQASATCSQHLQPCWFLSAVECSCLEMTMMRACGGSTYIWCLS